MRAAHAERKAARRAAKAFLRSLEPAARAAHYAMEPGDEGLAFLPTGEIVLLYREDDVRFRLKQLADVDAATDVGMRWLYNERAREAVQ